jgi:YD repeat-containing protein
MTTVNTLSFTYDAAGNMLTADDSSSSYAFDYDNLYRLVQSDNAGTAGVPNVVLDYEYDAAGNRVSTADDSGVTVESVYDDLDRLTSRTWDGGSIDEARIDFAYDARSQGKDGVTDFAAGG